MRDLAPLLSEGFQFSASDLAPRMQQEKVRVLDTPIVSKHVGYPAEFLADFSDFNPKSAQRRKQDHHGK